jgi:hypothetical protein
VARQLVGRFLQTFYVYDSYFMAGEEKSCNAFLLSKGLCFTKIRTSSPPPKTTSQKQRRAEKVIVMHAVCAEEKNHRWIEEQE